MFITFDGDDDVDNAKNDGDSDGAGGSNNNHHHHYHPPRNCAYLAETTIYHLEITCTLRCTEYIKARGGNADKLRKR